MESHARMCLYDADCGICTWCVQLGQRWDHHQRIAFVSNSDVSRWPAGVTADLLRETIVVVDRDVVLTRAHAVASLLFVLPFGRPLSFLLRAPGLAWLGDRMYRLVSNNRTRISARLGLAACDVPTGKRVR